MPHEINKFDLCLGGPFGATVQSQLVITNKTTQFMACAKPVIVGKTKISNLFLDKKNCLIVNQGSASSIANKILWAYQNQKQLKQIGLHGYALYQENLSQNVINNDIANILNRLKFKLN